MTATTITVPWGESELEITLPAGWRVLGVFSPRGLPPVSDVDDELRRALSQPIGMPPLREAAAGKQRVTIVVDDLSRPTPAARFLPRILDELQTAGVPLDGITLIPALGVHRAMSQQEMAGKVGAEVLERVQWRNHAFYEPRELVFLGTTSRRTPVYINRLVAEADFIVSVGCIEPHVIASFGGGYKNIIPGVAGQATVAANHALNCRPATFNMVGQPPERNPMRLDLEEGARMLNKPVFIVNAVLNAALQPVRIVAGDPIAAHRAGCQTSAELYGVQIPQLGDVVIANSFPMETDLRQGFKSLANTIRALRPGGVMLNLIRAREGVGDMNVPARRIPIDKKGMRIVAGLVLPFFKRLKLGGMRDDDKFFIYFALQTLKRYDVVFYAPTIPAEISERLRFLDFNADLGTALRKAAAVAPANASVLVFPHAGVTYPILPA